MLNHCTLIYIVYTLLSCLIVEGIECREDPIVIGPNQVGSPICLSCYSSVSSLDYLCTSCSYPLCGPDCQLR